MSEQPTTPSSQNTHSRWRKRLFWLGGIAAVCLAILVAIPVVTQRLATSWLQENGASAASIENIDINLFTGTVRLFGLDASGADPLQRLQVGLAEVDVQWWPLISKRVHVDAVRLSDARIDVANDSDGNWHVGGLRFAPQPAAQPEPEDASSPAVDWGLGSDVLSLTDVSLTYRDGLLDTDLEIREINLGSHYSWEPQDSVALVVEMSINDAPISFRSDVTPWSQDQSIVGALQVNAFDLEDNRQALQQYAGLADSRGTVSFDLTLSATRNAQGVIDLQVSGPLSVMDIGFSRDGLAFSNQEFTWEGQVNLFFPATGDQPLLVVDGETLVMGTQVSLDGMTVSNDVLDWQGNVTLFAPGAVDQPMLTHNGTLQLQGTAAELTAQELATRLDMLDYTGRVDVMNSQDSEAAPGISASGDVSGQGLLVQHARLPFDLVRLARVDVSDAQGNFPGPVSVQALQLQDLQLLLSEQDDANDTPAIFSLVQLAMANIGMDASGAITVDSVNLDEPAIYLVRNADGDLDRISALQAAFAADTSEDQSAESTVPVTEPTAGETGSAQPGFAIGEVTARATNFFNVTDAAVMPTVSFNLSELELAISNIDSAGANPVTVDLRSGNNSMALVVAGDVAVFAPTQSATLQVTLDALELPRFSSYIPGYNIDRGRLSTVSAISLNGEMLDIQNTVDLEQLRLAGKAAGDNAILAEGLSMPLDVALDLLRDGDDRIKLELPVTGSLSDPKFDSADIIRTVMQNALQNAAMSYVTNALQPLGTLLLIGNLANQASQPRFAPLDMRPAESALNPENREYLLKIGDLLKERPGLQLSMCGVATTADSEALLAIAISELPEPTEDIAPDVTPSEPQLPPPEITEADMLALAASRTRVVTDFLSAEAGISAERLFTCRETIDTEVDALPRVRISL